MIKQVCAVRDRAADAFGQPMFVPNKGIAIRSFIDEINRAEQTNQLYMHPEDFDLYALGEYDDNTGEIKSLTRPLQIAIGKDVKTDK